jgi:hypothetical protein
MPLRLEVLVLVALALVACDDKSPSKSNPEQPPVASSPAPDTCAPFAELDALDPRTPVPLQPMMAWHQKQNMQEHLVAIQRITDGLAREDWDEISEAAKLIETSPQMQQMRQHVGAGAEGFTELALEFHRRADAIGEAAGSHDGPAVLRATSNTLQACTGCHAAYRQEIVDATTWEQRTGSAHDPAMMHGH